ncbi:DUF6502 family protein [Marinobacter sp. AN1]|uniref:DUF6502 family protein n=1 Tax=Marinobacter sp. AN1 TaxID=2886046 RepID=UPI0022321A81|nr:DUF6502 family protein [Marinobacter sp. AN1]UZD64923.1 DUF6502 family protein [Marinobacter sp. AN1]
MSDHTPGPLHSALYRILRPLVRLLLRNGVPFGDFAELARRAYIETALKDFPERGRKMTDSRAAVLTGLTRKEVKRQREILSGQPLEPRQNRQGNRASRVVAGWVHDPRFQDAVGHPAVLTLDGSAGFAELVRLYSGDMTPRAVLDELLRVGVVAWKAEEGGMVELRKRAYVPAGDDSEMLHIFGEDVSDLVATIDYNLVSARQGRQPLFQRTLTYDNIPAEVIQEWRTLAGRQSQQLLEQLDGWLGPRDQDVSRNGEKTPLEPSVQASVSSTLKIRFRAVRTRG